MIETTLTVALTLEGPILTQGNGPGRFGFDMATARDASGRAYFPSTLVKGRLREAMAQLRSAPGVLFDVSDDGLFGKASGRAELGETVPDTPERGCLEFSDFLHKERDEQPLRTRHRIQIDPQRLSVKKGALLVMEDAFGSGNSVVFGGDIRFVSKSNLEAEAIVKALSCGFRWMPQLGAGRTTGFGRIRDVALTASHINLAIQAPSPEKKGRDIIGLTIAIRPLAPFCFSQHKIGGNLFESHPFIPGNAIKGCLAEMCRIAQIELPEYFDYIRFRHAFPSIGDQRARVAPLSIVEVNNELRDIAPFKDAVVFKRGGRVIAPNFRVDWKSEMFSKCDTAFAWKQPKTELRVRTAMDAKRRKGADGQLFAQELTMPGDITWRGAIDLAAVPEARRGTIGATLRAIIGRRLRYLGKTKAAAEVEITDFAAARTQLGETCRITLQTPALLGDTRFQNETDLNTCYREIWRAISDNSLELSHFFATQSLAGGNYLWQRFQRASHNPVYRPWLLTDAGSVFILSVRDAARAEKCITQWLSSGLPLPGWAKTEFTSDWRHNPFLPENGFSEIALDITSPEIATATEQEVEYA